MNLPSPDLGNLLKLNAKQKQVLRKCETELQRVAVKFDQYCFLFQTEALHATMTASATSFFSLIQESLTSDILHSIARLFDWFETGRGEEKNENCSLYWLGENLPKQPISDVG